MIYRVNKQIRVVSGLRPHVNAAWLRRGEYVELPVEVGKRYHRAGCFVVAKDQAGAAKLIVNKKKEKSDVKDSKKDAGVHADSKPGRGNRSMGAQSRKKADRS